MSKQPLGNLTRVSATARYIWTPGLALQGRLPLEFQIPLLVTQEEDGLRRWYHRELVLSNATIGSILPHLALGGMAPLR